jgi:redox-sensitive bicupin YhaK (pirin superfamily)
LPSTESLRRIRRVVNAPREVRGDGFAAAQLHPSMLGGGMDPYLQIDAFALSEPFFAPHPHAGFSAVTYILPESPTGFINRDSLGGRQRIAPGALHWTTAGRGVQHEEVPEMRGTAVLGLQMFINLAARDKRMAPGFIHLEPDEMPVHRSDGALARVVFGSSNGLSSPARIPTVGARLIDIELAPGGTFVQALEPSENCFLWVFGGSAVAVTPDGDRLLSTFDFAGYAPAGTRVLLRGGLEGARIALCGGPPLDEPVVASGPFVMSSAAQIEQAITEYRSGAMGQLSKSRYGNDGRPYADDPTHHAFAEADPDTTAKDAP